MVGYSQAREEERVIGIKAWLEFIEVLINVLNGAFEIGLLLDREVRCCKLVRWLALGMGVVK